MPKPVDMDFFAWAFTAFAAVSPNRTGIEFLSMQEVPDSYLVYNRVFVTPRGHFSNRFKRTATRLSFAYYTRNKGELEAKMEQIREIALLEGLIFINLSADRFHRETGHYAQNIDFYLIEEVPIP